MFCELHVAQSYGPTCPLSKRPTCQQVLMLGCHTELSLILYKLVGTTFFVVKKINQFSLFISDLDVSVVWVELKYVVNEVFKNINQLMD
jgi:hypothetical protein